MAKNIAKNRRQRESATKVLIELAKAYLETGVQNNPDEDAQIREAIRVLE